VAPEDVLELGDIQGNVIAGFNKPFMTFVYLHVQDSTAARLWLSELAPQLTTATAANDTKMMFRNLRTLRFATNAITGPAVVSLGIGAAFLRTLGFAPEALKDASFVNGLEMQSPFLGDPVGASRGAPGGWIVGNSANPLDLLLIVGSEDAQVAADKVTSLRADAEAHGFHVIAIDEGKSRADQPGHEHFGFNDGISQPGIRGRKSASPSDFFEERRIDPSDPINSIPGSPEFAAPGKPLVWPGQFVFGYPTQDGALQRSSAPPIDVPAWARNGSLMVFRRLYQDVRAFRDFIAQESAQTSITSAVLGARLVGRWASGASPVAYPDNDPGSTVGNDNLQNNSFQYAQPYGPITLKTGVIIPKADGDLFGQNCPFAGHLRKVNPRDAPTDEQSSAKTLTHRILRRGIPYGDPFDLSDPAADRGLLFVSYQTSIANQFEFLATNWMNRPDRPQSGGYDMIVGQNASGRQRFADVSDAAGNTQRVTSIADFVTPAGGGYLFAPSISFLKSLA
jgi:Dyp-type peroxidase family